MPKGGKNLRALLVKMVAANVLRQATCVWNPPIEQVNYNPKSQEGCSSPHSNRPSGGKAPSEPEQQEADYQIRTELIVDHGEVELPVPLAQRYPTVDLVIEEESSHADTRELVETCHWLPPMCFTGEWSSGVSDDLKRLPSGSTVG